MQETQVAPAGDLIIIGLDTADGESHPLYDRRILKRMPPAFVASVRSHGILQPVLIWMDGGRKIVIAGRQRVRAARVANVPVPYTVWRGGAGVLPDLAVIENEHRSGDSVSMVADKVVATLKRLGGGIRAMEETAAIFGCTVQTVRNRVLFANLHPQLKYAVDEHVILFTEAIKMHDLPPAEQERRALTAMGESVAPEGSDDPGASSDRRSARPKMKEIKERLKDPTLSADFREGAAWAAGLSLDDVEDPPNNGLLTVRDCSRMWAISAARIYQLIADGRLETEEHDGQIMIRSDGTRPASSYGESPRGGRPQGVHCIHQCDPDMKSHLELGLKCPPKNGIAGYTAVLTECRLCQRVVGMYRAGEEPQSEIVLSWVPHPVPVWSACPESCVSIGSRDVRLRLAARKVYPIGVARGEHGPARFVYRRSDDPAGGVGPGEDG